MFFDVSKTGLILLGASEYLNADQNRKAFAAGTEGIRSYFMNSRFGLGLQSHHILDLFNDKKAKIDQNRMIDIFLRASVLQDLFIYVCGHAYVRNADLCVQLAASTDDFETTLLLEPMLDRICSLAQTTRLYVIVDTCDSGILNRQDPYQPLSPEQLRYLSHIDAVKLPRAGMTILTANSSDHVGKVYASDDLPDMKEPLFTHELLKLLRFGVKHTQSFGLTIEGICGELSRTVPEKLKSILQVDTLPVDFLGNFPQFSDQPIIEPEHTVLVSSIAIFPNNDKHNSLALKAAKRVRFAYEIEENQREQIKQLTSELKEERQKSEKIQPLELELERQRAQVLQLSKQLAVSNALRTVFGVLFSLCVVVALAAAYKLL